MFHLLKNPLFIYSFLLLSFSLTHGQVVSLNGAWDFTADPENKFTVESLTEKLWRTAKVPLSWQAQFEDLRDYQGVAWYKKTFLLPSIKKENVVLIKFNAVDYMTEVFINKKTAGKHEGGYTPFEFDITKLIHKGANEVIVRVMDPVNDEKGTEGISYRSIPHGKQNWYVQTSGIWQNAAVIIKPGAYIKKLHITAAADGSFKINLNFSKPANGEKLNLVLKDKEGNILWSQIPKIYEDQTEIKLNGRIESPDLWSFNNPHLYTIEAELGDDKFIDKFGFRSIEAKNKKLYLNGEQFYLIGALDQDFYPETIYSAPSEEFIKEEMLKAKHLGLNLLRCHIKVPDPVYLKAADETGMLVWYEVPNWDEFSPEAAERGARTIDEMLDRDWNHPSLVILSLINESWGIDLQEKEEREWLLKEFHRVKEKAEGRLVVDNSACYGNFHLKSDLNDYHTYSSIPDNKEEFDRTIDELSARPDWLFSKFGDSEETGNEPLLLSEFGNWGLPMLPVTLPWWLERKFYDVEVSLPLGYEKRFNEYRYNEIFNSYSELAEESQRVQFRALKYEIETIRMNPEFSGYVITEFTDINWECNGLLDMRRNFKIYSDELPLIQQQDVIIPRPLKYNYFDNEEAEIKIYISHFSSDDLNSSELKWQTESGDSGSIILPEIKWGEVREIESIKIKFNSTAASKKETIEFLIKKNKKEIAKNFTDIFVFPSGRDVRDHSLTVYDPGKSLKSFTGKLKNDFNFSESSSLIITNIIDDSVLTALSDGSSIICLIDSSTVLPESSGMKILSRYSEWYDGNWASNFNWKRNDHPVFRNLHFSASFGFETAASSPEWVITGIPAEKSSNLLAGMFIGWIHLNSGFIVQMEQGKGRLLLCAFPIAENYPDDPFVFNLFLNLIDYAAGKDFKPDFKLNQN